ncbi:MAG TPA: hypothetical protein VK821_05145 [Dehalococcoidia bacterium]|nr:hypothetical protein [Dehalococcoidia bacterium]
MPSRRRRRRGQDGGTLVDRRGRPVAPWKWLTFPVYFALAVGLFAGYDVGLLLVAKAHPHWEGVTTLVFAALFAFGLSQLATRPLTEMMLHRRARQRERGGAGPRTED